MTGKAVGKHAYAVLDVKGDKMDILSDEYLFALMEQGQEVKVASSCVQCYEDLYEGQEIAVDWNGNNFCEEGCACEYHGIKNTFIDFGMAETCEYCGTTIYENESAVMDSEGTYYCDRACFEYDKQIETKIL